MIKTYCGFITCTASICTSDREKRFLLSAIIVILVQVDKVRMIIFLSVLVDIIDLLLTHKWRILFSCRFSTFVL
jgi:hypothetical protein